MSSFQYARKGVRIEARILRMVSNKQFLFLYTCSSKKTSIIRVQVIHNFAENGGKLAWRTHPFGRNPCFLAILGMSGPGKRAMVDRRQPVVLTPTSQAYPYTSWSWQFAAAKLSHPIEGKCRFQPPFFKRDGELCIFGGYCPWKNPAPSWMKLQTKLTWDK